jgi:hypothetical protein
MTYLMVPSSFQKGEELFSFCLPKFLKKVSAKLVN